MSIQMIASKLTPIRGASKLMVASVRAMAGEGSGKGGGSGGSIRDAGGSFGKRESAQEDQYFRKKQKEQLDKIQGHLKDEISTHEKLIKEHEEAIAKTRKHIEDLSKS